MATLAMQMDAMVGTVVLPGDQVTTLPSSGTIRVGGGVQQSGTSLVATKAGLVRTGPGNTLWVGCAQRRYIPNAGDAVVGIITRRHSENYTVDICGPWSAMLPTLAFEGVARRNKPNLQIGDVVFCRVDEAARDLDPTLSCTDSTGKAAGFGPLKGGTIFYVSTQHARTLAGAASFLAVLGRSIKFELAVGANGRVWISAALPGDAALVARVARECEGLTQTQAETLASAALEQRRQGV